MKNSGMQASSLQLPHARQQVISLKPMSSPSSRGYVWRRVFLREGKYKER